ncbi:MAG: glycosyltransferase family 39 protein [Lewinellaceae bacterium]|nr:glycosyltransferase family 39 protein [Lewinellaceae bacterium]
MSNFIHGIRAIPTGYLVVFILALFLPAHLINLGVAAFNGDEAIRSLVALEMKMSGNYIATTMHGAPYINKPPLFNWMLLVSFKLFGYFGEFPARVVTVFFLAVYGFVVYRFTRKEFGNAFAFLCAMMTILSGRFLIYDSMLGLIDTTFSVVIYSLFMSMYYFGSRGQWQRLFLVSYGLMTVGFLLKGLPAIVFQGLSLLAGLWFFGQLRRLFSWQHVGAGLLSLAVLAGYLAIYAQYRPLDILLPNLLHESVKRTGVVFGWWNTVVHFFKFPFESVYHFLPFSLLVLAWFDRRFWQRLRANRFAWFNFVILAANLPIYWSSVQVYARYLLMFIPLFTTFSFYLMQQDQETNSWRFKIYYGILGVLGILLPVAFAAMPFVPEVNFLENIWPLSIAFGLVLLAPAVGFFADRKRYVYWTIISLLVARIAFDLIILPTRHHENITSRARTNIRALVDKYHDQTWYTYGRSILREPASFYMTQKLGYIVQNTTDTSHKNAIYVVNPDHEPDGDLIFGGPPVDTFQTDYTEIKLLLYLTSK